MTEAVISPVTMRDRAGWKAAGFLSSGLFALMGVALLLSVTTGARATESQVLILGREDCLRLVRHEPSADVAFRPGEGPDGRKVAPADLEETPRLALPEELSIAITVDMADRFGIPILADLFRGEVAVGTVRLRLEDGRAWFNGTPLGSEDQAALASLCREILSRPAR